MSKAFVTGWCDHCQEYRVLEVEKGIATCTHCKKKVSL